MATDSNRQDERLSAYIDGELPPDQAESVRQAMASDERARKMVESLYQLQYELSRLPRYELPAGIVTAAWEEVRSGKGVAPVGSERRGHRWRSVAAALLVVASAIALILLVRPGVGPVGPQAPEVAQSPSAGSTGDSAGAAATSPVDQSQPLPVVGQYMLVVELWPSRKALDERLFEQALATYGIAFDRSIPVDRKLEQALLESRILKQRRLKAEGAAGKASGGILQAEPDRGDDSQSADLVFVLAPAKDIDRMIMDLKADRDSFPKVKFDLAVKPEQLKVFQQLRRQAETILASHGTVGKPHAMRLDFGMMPARHGMLRPSKQLPLALLGMFTMMVSQDASSAIASGGQESSAASGQPAGLDPVTAARIRQLEAMEAEVLFVIHPPTAK